MLQNLVNHGAGFAFFGQQVGALAWKFFGSERAQPRGFGLADLFGDLGIRIR